MVRFKNSFLLTCLMLAFGLGLAPYAMATDNIINNIPPLDPACSPALLLTYADVDGNPTTGAWVYGTWYPNEIQIALYALDGDMTVNTGSNSGQIFFSHVGANCGETGWQTKKGKFAIRFVDIMAPGWVWNDETTWQPARIKEAEFLISHNEQANYSAYFGPGDPGNLVNSNPILRVQALNEIAGVFDTVDIFEDSGALPSPTPVTLSSAGGFSELLVTTDFAENILDDLRLWTSIVPANANTLEGFGVEVCGDSWWYPCATGICYGGNGLDTVICVTFSVVTRAGNTKSMGQIHHPEWPALKIPVNFMTSCGDSYQIWTTAQYAGGATVCIEYDDTCDESDMRLFQYQGGAGYGAEDDVGAWVDITTSVDTAANIVCGYVSALEHQTPVPAGTILNTPVGSDVEVTIDGVTITFEDIAALGDTTVTESDSGPDPPPNFQVSCTPPVYYNITTTADYSGIITICLSYDESVCDESDLHLFHYVAEADTWVEVPASIDTAANRICGEVTSLSAFLLATPIVVGPIPPVANASASPLSGTAPLTVDFTGTGTDADGVIVLYEWDFEGDGTYDWSSPSAGVTAHTYSADGQYDAVLRVTDNDGLADTDTVRIDVSPPDQEIPVAVDDLVTISIGRIGYDRRTGQFSVSVTVTNTSAETIGSPVWLVIESVSSPSVTVANADGTTADGKEYLDLSGLLGDGQLAPGESTTKRIYFNNSSRVRFTFVPGVRGVI